MVCVVLVVVKFLFVGWDCCVVKMVDCYLVILIEVSGCIYIVYGWELMVVFVLYSMDLVGFWCLFVEFGIFEDVWGFFFCFLCLLLYKNVDWVIVVFGGIFD